MSIKALQRRAREARHWLGERALPLWSEVGCLRGEDGFLRALALNHRPPAEPEAGDVVSQQALIALFRLAPWTGFPVDTATACIESALIVAGKEVPPQTGLDAPASRSLPVLCDQLRTRLASFAGGAGEDAILGAKAACRSFDQLMDEFLTPEGGWIMGYDEAGLPVVQDIPALGAGPVATALGPLVALLEA